MISKQSKLEIPESRTHWADQHSVGEPKCQYGGLSVDQHSSPKVQKFSCTIWYPKQCAMHLKNFVRNYLWPINFMNIIIVCHTDSQLTLSPTNSLVHRRLSYMIYALYIDSMVLISTFLYH